MRHRIARLGLVLGLVAAAVGGAFVIYRDFQATPLPQTDEVDRRVDRLLALILDLHAAQAAYVAPAQNPIPSLERFPTLFKQLTTLTGETSPLLGSPAGIREIATFADATSALAHADASAREHLLLGDVLSASHVVFQDADAAAKAMTEALVRLRAAERAEARGSGERIPSRARPIMAAVGALWVAGLLVLAFVPAVPTRPRNERGLPLEASEAPVATIAEPAQAPPAGPASRTVSGESSPAPALDLNAVADLCTEIERVESAATLQALLHRIVRILDADGLVIWAENNAQLFAVAAAGYAPDTLARLLPIRRQDEHAVAAAWREASVETVDATSERDGAIAVPLFSGETCTGVFAVELRPGREHDPATRAVVRMLAAQLSAVVTGAPAEGGAQARTGT